MLVGVVGFFAPNLIGGGDLLASQLLSQPGPLAMLPLLFAVRFLLTLASYGSGAPGGIFAPLLVLGVLLGQLVGLAGQVLAPSIAPDPTVTGVVAMAAFFTAIVRVPITGVVLIQGYRDTSAIHAKLDEIVVALRETRNDVVGLEHQDPEKIKAALDRLEKEAGCQPE